MLMTTAAIIVLINAGYQDGQPEHLPPRLLRYAGSLGAAVLVPLVALTAYGLMLRVGQYGWTADRIVVAAAIGIAAWHALGYALALLRRGTWLKWLEATNTAGAFLVLLVLLALFTPVADPARISVGSQVARLESGRIAPDEFDFTYLRFDAGRYGRDALERLKAHAHGPRAEDIKARATKASQLTSRPFQREIVTPEVIVSNVTVHGDGRSLPDGFLKRDWTAFAGVLPQCLRSRSQKCDAFFINLDGNGAEELVLASGLWPYAVVFRMLDDGRWVVAGRLSATSGCEVAIEALRRGEAKIVAPLWNDLEAGGHRLQLDTGDGEGGSKC